VRSRVTASVATGAFLVLFAAPAAAQIPRDQYLKYLPLTYPTLVRATAASQRF